MAVVRRRKGAFKSATALRIKTVVHRAAPLERGG
jgi:hypothetical protein